MAKLLNFALFQLGWLACVLGGAWQLPWLGTAIAAAIVGWHLHIAARPRGELQLLLMAGALGATWDSLLVTAGLLIYPSGTLIAGTAPHWIVAMWMLFATTLNLSLDWLKGRYLLSVLAGAAGGPLAFYAGMRLGGVYMPDPQAALLVLAAGWAVMMPLLAWLAQRFDGVRETCPAPQALAGR
jgi:hypothetical protein